VRKDSVFRDWIVAKDAGVALGTAQGTGKVVAFAEPGRFHLYVANACPWAHRTRVVRKLKGLEGVIGISFVDYLLEDKGWRFEHPDRPAASKDNVNGLAYLRDVYSLSTGAPWTDRVTVPVLFDTHTNTIVNNESSEIIQMFNSAFNAFSETAEQAALDLYPAEKRAEIDELNAWVYDGLNNGVYKAGFARSQEAYSAAAKGVFETLDKLEVRLAKSRFLFGNHLTLADVRAFTTLVRFDPVYHHHFKCNKRTLTSYPNLWGYVRDLYNLGNLKDTVDLEDARKHYYLSHTSINPFSILPIGPELDYSVPEERRKL